MKLQQEDMRKYILDSKILEKVKEELELISDLVDDLGWEYQRMTESGKESYEKLCKALGWKFDWNEEELG